MVLVEETPGRGARKLSSATDRTTCRTIAPPGVADVVDSVVLLMIVGVAPPAYVAQVVAADAASFTLGTPTVNTV